MPAYAGAKVKQPAAKLGAGPKVKATNLADRKLAPIFTQGGGAATSKAKNPAAKPANAAPGTYWNSKEGKAYRVDKSGNRFPCEI